MTFDSSGGASGTAPGFLFQHSVAADSGIWILPAATAAVELSSTLGWFIETRIDAQTLVGGFDSGMALVMQDDAGSGYWSANGTADLLRFVTDNGAGADLVVDVPLSDGFHVVRMQRAPGAPNIEFFIDGVSQHSGLASTLFTPDMYWGDGASSSGGNAVWDYVGINSAPVIPEPSSILLLALGGLVLPISRRITRRRIAPLAVALTLMVVNTSLGAVTPGAVLAFDASNNSGHGSGQWTNLGSLAGSSLSAFSAVAKRRLSRRFVVQHHFWAGVHRRHPRFGDGWAWHLTQQILRRFSHRR